MVGVGTLSSVFHCYYDVCTWHSTSLLLLPCFGGSSRKMTSIESLSLEEREKFNQLVVKAKEVSGRGNVRQALSLYKEAQEIYPNEKLTRRIQKMEVRPENCRRMVWFNFIPRVGIS